MAEPHLKDQSQSIFWFWASWFTCKPLEALLCFLFMWVKGAAAVPWTLWESPSFKIRCLFAAGLAENSHTACDCSLTSPGLRGGSKIICQSLKDLAHMFVLSSMLSTSFYQWCLIMSQPLSWWNAIGRNPQVNCLSYRLMQNLQQWGFLASLMWIWSVSVTWKKFFWETQAMDVFLWLRTSAKLRSELRCSSTNSPAQPFLVLHGAAFPRFLVRTEHRTLPSIQACSGATQVCSLSCSKISLIGQGRSLWSVGANCVVA